MWVETTAVVFAVVYLLLAVRQNIWCWPAAFVSSALFLQVFYGARLYMVAALQVFYLVMAIYGWWQWRHGGEGGKARTVSVWSPGQHIIALTVVLSLAMLSRYLLTQYTDEALPFLDSLISWGGVVATFMVARKILENWLYWFAIDSISIYLYVRSDLYQTALLFAVYLVLIVFGYLAWRKDLPGSPTPAGSRE